MDLLAINPSQKKSHRIRSVFLSICFHAFLVLLIAIFPWFHHSSKTILPTLDVTLMDAPDMDILPPSSVEKSTGAKMKKKSKLTDPSEAEIKRMKKRKKIPRHRKTEAATSFQMPEKGLGGFSGKTSGSIRLDTLNFPFVYYLSMLRNRISENWIPPAGTIVSKDSKRVVVKFWIDRSGKVIRPQVEESSNNPALDNSALRAVIVSSPFPPLPDAYPEASLGVHFGFRCEL